MKCIFCDFNGTLEELKQHSESCEKHPAVRKLRAHEIIYCDCAEIDPSDRPCITCCCYTAQLLTEESLEYLPDILKFYPETWIIDYCHEDEIYVYFKDFKAVKHSDSKVEIYKKDTKIMEISTLKMDDIKKAIDDYQGL